MKRENLDRLLSDIRSRLTGDLILHRYAPHEDAGRAYKDGDYKIRCFLPGHTEDTPSLSVSHDKFVYNCFGKCGPGQKSGDFITLIRIMNGVGFMDAVEIASSICGLNMEDYEAGASNEVGTNVVDKSIAISDTRVVVNKDDKPRINDVVVTELVDRLANNNAALEWLMNERCLSLDTILERQLGVDKYGNISIPIYEDGILVNIKYRKNPSGDSNGPKYWSHKSKIKGVVYKYGEARLFGTGHLVDGNSDNSSSGGGTNKLVICAGEFDCMLLNQESDGSIVAVAPTAGEGMWDDAWNEICTRLGPGGIYVCFDNDEAGDKGVIGLQKKFPHVHKISLAGVVGDKGDITDYFCGDGGFGGFVGLVEAGELSDGRIISLDPVLDTKERQTLLDSMSDNKTVRMNPAFYVDPVGVVYITAMYELDKTKNKTIEVDGEKITIDERYTTIEPVIISSERGLWPIPRMDKDTLRDDPFAVEKFNSTLVVCQEPDNAQEIWAHSDVKNFLKTGKLYSNIKAAYNDIYYNVKRYSRFTRRTHRGLVSLYIMGSYFYEGFQSFPYMLLTGEKNSGKSTLGAVMKELSFNGEFTVNPSVAWLARRVEEFKGLIVIDEIENQSQRSQGRDPLGQVLNSGYKKGARRTICNVDNKNKAQSFDVYCPKVFTSIYGMNDVTQSRCIIIRMRRARVVVRMDSIEDESMKRVSRHMYQIMMGYTPSVLASYVDVNNMAIFHKIDDASHGGLDVYARERELYIPLLTMAHFIHKETGFSTPWNMLIDELSNISCEKDEDSEEEPEVLLRQSLADIMEAENVDEREFNMHELVTGYKGQYVEDPGHKCQRWISRTIGKMGWCKKDNNGRARKSVEIATYDSYGNKVIVQKKVRCFNITRDGLGMEPTGSEMKIPF